VTIPDICPGPKAMHLSSRRHEGSYGKKAFMQAAALIPGISGPRFNTIKAISVYGSIYHHDIPIPHQHSLALSKCASLLSMLRAATSNPENKKVQKYFKTFFSPS
jgi:hypothetical protein